MGVQVTSTNRSCGVVDAVTFDFSKPAGATVITISTILQKSKSKKEMVIVPAGDLNSCTAWLCMSRLHNV